VPVTVDRLLVNIGQAVTAAGESGPVRGPSMRALRIVPDAVIAVHEGRVAWVGPRSQWTGTAYHEVDLGGRAVVPGLVDPHTHVVWGGDRLDDFESRASGITYEQLLAAGGGIRHTMRETARRSPTELARIASPRVRRLVQAGATTIEIKTGYGMTPSAELRLLEVIEILRQTVPARLVPTLLFHVPPTDPVERQQYLSYAMRELIPAVAREGSATAIDIFVEQEAFTVAEAEILMQAARMHGLGVKLHADQFHVLGGVELAVRLGALSVDHLEASSPAQHAAIAASTTVATILPGVTLHLGMRAANGRALIDAGAAVAVGTDCNPGSSPLFSQAAAMGLAVRINGMTPAEAFTACTANAAAALGLHSVGRLNPGMRADLCVLRGNDWRELPYLMGDDAVESVWLDGREVKL
jgi:imidazolonepropionase